MGGYRIMVDDNFHYMDESERYEAGTCDTEEEAVAICRLRVDQCLEGFLKPGVTAAELLTQYHHFGEDPFVLAPEGQPMVEFSAWKYAAQRVDDLTRQDGDEK